jgi:hypothetical protein
MELAAGTQAEGAALGVLGKRSNFCVPEFLISASCSALMKLSGVAVPSCCCGSSQRAAILVCQANTILPLGTMVAAPRAARTNGMGSVTVANAVLYNNLRRVSFMFSSTSAYAFS